MGGNDRAQQQTPLGAEIVAGAVPAWHVVVTFSQQDRKVVQKLSVQGFGVYQPQLPKHPRRHHGEDKDERMAPMLPNYVFVFVWDVRQHYHRIRACPGVFDFLYAGEHVAVVPDRLIDRIRAVENAKRPLPALALPKKRWRRRPRNDAEDQEVGNEIVAVHSYSPFIEAMRLDGSARIGAFHRALGLCS